ncbi:MAG: hypothetical protein HZA50_04435 [Planctomycetes bacterium]|nr:hypothetical protein [Planctomycetota bacterium]
MSVQYDIHLAQDDPKNIDWSSPLAAVNGGSAAVSLSQPLQPGGGYVLAAKARFQSGRQEQNTHVLCRFEIDQAGQLVPWRLAAPRDVCVRLETPGAVRVSFSVGREVGCERPDRFEILSDGGSGELDFNEPAGVIENFPATRSDFSTTATAAALPAIFAVRPARQGRPGPISRIVRVVQAPAPSAVSLL